MLPGDCKRCEARPFAASGGAPRHLRRAGLVSGREVGTLKIPQIFHRGFEYTQEESCSARPSRGSIGTALGYMTQFSGKEGFHIIWDLWEPRSE